MWYYVEMLRIYNKDWAVNILSQVLVLILNWEVTILHLGLSINVTGVEKSRKIVKFSEVMIFKYFHWPSPHPHLLPFTSPFRDVIYGKPSLYWILNCVEIFWLLQFVSTVRQHRVLREVAGRGLGTDNTVLIHVLIHALTHVRTVEA